MLLKTNGVHPNTGKTKSDLSGQIFGKLKVLHIDYDKIGKTRGSYYICDCACGNTVSKSRHSLIKLHTPTRSCGCLQKEVARNSVLSDGRADRNYWIRKYKKRAKDQEIEFTLSDQEFFELSSQLCFYCDDPPIQRSHGYKSTYGSPFLANGLDRVEPKKGYTKDNVVPCCTDCNLQKRDTSQSEFIKKANKIAKKHNKEIK